MWPVLPLPATYSVVGKPMRLIRHSSVSALPVETAMSGMLSFAPAPFSVPGKDSDLSVCGASAHDVFDVSTVMARRHLPTWRTSGTAVPTGALSSLNVPSTLVVVATHAPLLKSAPQLHASAPVGTPFGSACNGPPGT